MNAQAETSEFCQFDNTYARLPDRFFARLRPTPVAAPRLVKLNTKLALDLGLDPEQLTTPEGVEILPAIRCRREATRSPSLMRATSLGLSSLSSVMDVQFLLAK